MGQRPNNAAFSCGGKGLITTWHVRRDRVVTRITPAVWQECSGACFSGLLLCDLRKRQWREINSSAESNLFWWKKWILKVMAPSYTVPAADSEEINNFLRNNLTARGWFKDSVLAANDSLLWAELSERWWRIGLCRKQSNTVIRPENKTTAKQTGFGLNRPKQLSNGLLTVKYYHFQGPI